MTREDVLILLTIACVTGLFAWQVQAGLLRERIFAGAPDRAGRLTLLDLAFGLLLMIGGQIFGTAVVMLILDEPNTPTELLITSLAGELGMLPGVLLVMVRVRQTLDGGMRGFGFRIDGFGDKLLRTIRVVLFTVPATFLAVSAGGTLWNLFGGHTPSVGHPVLLALRETQSWPVKAGLIGMAVVAAPVLEEFFFRGLVQTTLLNSKLLSGRWAVIVVASALFAAVHAGSVPWAALPGLFVLGLGLGYLYERTGAIWTNMALHVAFNAVNIAAVLLQWVPG